MALAAETSSFELRSTHGGQKKYNVHRNCATASVILNQSLFV